MTKYAGWRTMTAAQRSNAKRDRVWEEYKRLEREKYMICPRCELKCEVGDHKLLQSCIRALKGEVIRLRQQMKENKENV
jgi:hypothetical protein